MIKLKKYIIITSRFTAIILIMAFLVSCSTTKEKSNTPETNIYCKAIRPGMTQWRVKAILGTPTQIRHRKNYMSFIPLLSLFTSEWQQIIYTYKGRCKVVFSHTRSDENIKVIDVIPIERIAE